MSGFVNIVLPLPLRKEFTYSVPDGESPKNLIGKRAIVGFGPRKMTGFIVSESLNTDEIRTSAIEEIPGDLPVFTPEMLSFCRWMSDYYICGYGEVLKLALPSLLMSGTSVMVSVAEDAVGSCLEGMDKNIFDLLKNFGPLGKGEIEKALGKDALKHAGKLRKKGYILYSFPAEEKKKEVMLRAYTLNTGKDIPLELKDNVKINAVLQYFSEKTVLYHKDTSPLKMSPSAVRKLAGAGVLNEAEMRKDHFDSVLLEKIRPAPPLVLNDEQAHCADEILKAVRSGGRGTFLLHGITGSGKTMVYIAVVSEVLRTGKTAVIMVPEISLTPQTVRNFRAYLGDSIAILHSRMSDREKYESWLNIRSGRYRVVIGPRSAIFAPVAEPGIIIVDEEHDSSYKQTDKAPRYCGRNSAVMRGYLSNFPVVLGSATPSAESYHNALSGKYRLLELKKRYTSAGLPDIRIIKKQDPGKLFEQVTVRVIAKELEAGRKAIVLQNRRGYSSHLLCRNCGQSAGCPNCSVSLTYHLSKKQLICHHCGYYEKGRDTCPSCGGDNIYFRGAGTQQVENELRILFPEVPVFRMDHDSTRAKDSHKKILDSFGEKGPAILTGTRMIAKGLDFHDVSVVCVVNIDSELIFPDFRSDERAFQMLQQVSGRAGRGAVKGKVIIQTFNPDNGIIKLAADHDYETYIKDELEMRKITSYPPFASLVKITLSSKDLSKLKEYSSLLYDKLNELNNGCTVYRPVEKMIHKVNNIFRLYILIKSVIITPGNKIKASGLAMRACGSLKSFPSVKTDIDVDPSDIM